MPTAGAALWSASVDLQPTDRMLFWLGRAARKSREEAELVRSQIAGAVAIDQSAVQRFERGESWPQRLDELLIAYAELSGLEDPRAIWDRALALWRQATEEPARGATAADRDALRRAAASIQQQRPASPGGTRSGSGATRKRRAAG